MTRVLIASSLVLLALLPGSGTAQQVGQPGKLDVQKVAGSVSMLAGRGGNIGLSVGKDGVFMIDDQFADQVGKIRAAIKTLSDQPVKFLINTHWHGDHTGGNEILGKSGAVIVAHANVRKRLSTEQFIKAFNYRNPAQPEEALPVITFTRSVTFHWNDDEIRVFHVEHAHTDGDAIIHFVKADVLHTGDVYFNGMYPVIDFSTGGTIDGMITAVKRCLMLAGEKTKIIPGHGPLSGAKRLREYLTMLETVSTRLEKHLAAGKTVEEVVAAKPTADLDESWGRGRRSPDDWVRMVYGGMLEAKKD